MTKSENRRKRDVFDLMTDYYLYEQVFGRGDDPDADGDGEAEAGYIPAFEIRPRREHDQWELPDRILGWLESSDPKDRNADPSDSGFMIIASIILVALCIGLFPLAGYLTQAFDRHPLLGLGITLGAAIWAVLIVLIVKNARAGR